MSEISDKLTAEAVTMLNKIINHCASKDPSSPTEVTKVLPDVVGIRPNTGSKIFIGPPGNIYREALGDNILSNPIFKWTLWWAKEAGIISHHGPAGSKGMAIYRLEPLSKEDIVLSFSPFDTETLAAFNQNIMKLVANYQLDASKMVSEAAKTAREAEMQLEAEKKRAKLSKKLNWS